MLKGDIDERSIRKCVQQREFLANVNDATVDNTVVLYRGYNSRESLFNESQLRNDERMTRAL